MYTRGFNNFILLLKAMCVCNFRN